METLRERVHDDLESLVGGYVPDGELDRLVDHVVELIEQYRKPSRLPKFLRRRK